MIKRVLIITSLIITFSSMISCIPTKKTKETETLKRVSKESEMKAKGFTSGTINHSTKEGDCEYIIKTIDGATYDPINILEEFKIDEQQIWFTFSILRRANRCPNASPINITKMIKNISDK